MGLDEKRILAGLRTRFVGRRLIVLDETTSTNDEIQNRAEEPEGLVATAGRQTAGRGRRGRVWTSLEGDNLYFSLLVKPRLTPESVPALTLLAGLCTCETIRALTGLDAGIKWPNDVMCQGKKLCGILTEGAFLGDGTNYAIIGIGVNLNAKTFPPDLPAAGSLYQLTGQTWNREDFLAALLNSLEERYTQFVAGGFAAIRPDYEALSITLGKMVDIHAQNPFFGKAVGIAADGSLLVETEEGVVTVNSGEATLRERK